jgi:hypothetical protein
VRLGEGEFGYFNDGQDFRFVFADIQPKRLTVRGRDLLRIYDQISPRRMPLIRLAERDFRPGDGAERAAPIITGTEVPKLKRR